MANLMFIPQTYKSHINILNIINFNFSTEKL